MNNTIWGKSPLHIMQNAYMRLPASSMIKGTLVEQRDNMITIDLGNQKLLEARLKSPIRAEVGDQVTIDRREMVSSRVFDGPIDALQGKEEQVSRMLKALGLPHKEEMVQSLKALDTHGVPLSQESIMTYLKAKEYVDRIIGDLDYDKAVQLVNRDTDVEGESLQNVVKALEEIKGAKTPFSIWRLLKGKKEMATAEAEKIARNLYGSPMGKDTHDIIKALHRAGAEITKQNINQINDIFHKLNSIQQMDDQTLIQSVESQIEPSIDYLYKLKHAIVKGSIAGKEKISPLRTRAYEGMGHRPQQVTEKDLKRMEGDIKELLGREGLRVSEDIVGLAKEFIRNGLEVSKENINRIQEIKTALGELKHRLDYEKTAALLQAGVKVEKENVVALAERVQELGDVRPIDSSGGEGEKIERFLRQLAKIDEMDEKRFIQLMKSGREIKLENLIKSISQETIDEVGAGKLGEGSLMEGSGVLHSSMRVLQSLNRLQNLDFDTMAFQMNNRLPMTLEGLARSYHYIHGHGDPEIKEGVENGTLQEMRRMGAEAESTIRHYIEENQSFLGVRELKKNFEMAKALIQNNMTISRENMMELYRINSHMEQIKGNITINTLLQGADQGLQLGQMEISQLAQHIGETSNLFSYGLERLQVLDILGSIGENTLAFQLEHKLPLTLEALQLSQRLLHGEIDTEELKNNFPPEVAKLLERRLEEGRSFESEFTSKYGGSGSIAQQIQGIQRQIETIQDYLKESVVAKSRVEGIDLEKMDLKSLMEYARKVGGQEEGSLKNGPQALEKLKVMTENLSSLGQHRESVLSLLIKNAMPMTLKEVQGMSMFLKNQEQMSSQVDEIARLIENHPNEEIKEVGIKIKSLLGKLSNELKAGKLQTQKPYEEIGRLLKELEGKAGLLEGETKEALQKSGRKLLDSLELQSHLNKEDTVFQLPLMLENQLQNLQIYIMNHKKGGKKIDPNNMSVLLNFDTRNMGNVNIYLGVTGKKVLMKMGIGQEEDRKLIEGQVKQLEELLGSLGYELKEMTFRVEEDQHIMTLREEAQGKDRLKNNYVDIRI